MLVPTTNRLRATIPVDRIKTKLQFALDNEKTRHELMAMRFDAEFTKPASLTGFMLASWMLDLINEQDVVLKEYKQNYFAWRLFPVNSNVNQKKPLNINVNVRQLARRPVAGIESWEETIFHELVHVVDAFHVENFGHGDNERGGKEEAAPAKFARYMATLTIN